MLQPVSHIRLVNLIQVQILHSQTLHQLASECPQLDKQRVSPTPLHLSTLSVKDGGCQQCHRGINLNAAIGRAFRFMARPISIPIKWPFFYKKKKKRSFLLETTMVRTVVSTPLLQKKVQIRFFLKPLPFHMQGYQMLMMLGSHRLGHISESWSQDHICFLLPYKERYSNSNTLNGFALDSRLFTDCI